MITVFGIPNTMTLDKIQKQIKYQIIDFSDELKSDASLARLQQLGMTIGAPVELVRKAPIFRDPLLISVESTNLAISKAQASHILVQEVSNG